MNRLTVLVCILAISQSCDPKKLGPLGSFANTNWKLVEYRVKGQQRPLSDVPDRAFLETQDIDTTSFAFKDSSKKTKIFEQYFLDKFDVSKQQDVGYYYFKTADKRFCRVVIGWNNSQGFATKLEVGNLMDGSYRQNADSVRYYYVPN